MAQDFVPMTLQSNMKNLFGCQVVIGKRGSQSKFQPDPYTLNSLWFLVLDRSTLKQVYSQSSQNNDNPPSGLSKYLTSDYILCVASNALDTDNVPQGPLYDLLSENGAGQQLQRLVQINAQLSCGSIGQVSYILVNVPGTGLPGLEENAIIQGPGVGAVMTAQLLPTVINGKTVYTPVEVQG
jgi:hypothetical protein